MTGPVGWLVGRSVCHNYHNFLKGREVPLSWSYRSTCLSNQLVCIYLICYHIIFRPTGNISNIVEKKPKLQQQQQQQLLHQLPSQTNQSINNFQPQQQQQLPKQQQQKQTQKQQQNKILQQQQRLVSSLSATTAIGATAAGGGTTVGGSYGSTTTPNLAKLLSDTNTTYTVEEKVQSPLVLYSDSGASLKAITSLTYLTSFLLINYLNICNLIFGYVLDYFVCPDVYYNG